MEIEKIDSETDFYLSFYTNDFYNQDRIIKTLWKRIKMAFSILRGKSYRLNEIVLTKKDLLELKEKIEQIIK